jgi:type 1 glutamine amidotransferase
MRSPILSSTTIGLVAFCSLALAEETESTQPSKPNLVIVIAEGEYKTDQTLPPFAQSNLANDFSVKLLFASENDPYDIPGLESLETADVVLLSIRRRTLATKQLEMIRAYISAGKPLVAMRTSSHAFCLRTARPEPGRAEWPEFDQQILGCNYRGHHGNAVKTYVKIATKAAEHPILEGIQREEFRVFGSLYQSLPLHDSAQLLMVGRAEEIIPHEPVAWTNRSPDNGRVFYTSLGHPKDFAVPGFVRLLRNGVYWAADRPMPTREVVVNDNPPDK